MATFHLKQCTISSLPHLEIEHKQCVNSFWSGILRNQGIVRIYEIITALLTTLGLLNTKLRRKNIDSKITDVATCKVIKKVILDVNYAILIEYNSQTAKPRPLYESSNWPALQPADNLPNSDGLGDVPRAVPELTVWVCWQPKPWIWQRFGSDLDPDLKVQSRTVANTMQGAYRCCF